MKSVALATTTPDVLNGEDVDVDLIVNALHTAGVLAEPRIWHDPSVDWASYDAVVLRSPWDYPERYGEFLDWLEQTSGVTHILNQPEVVRWNLDKSYMLELGELGAPIVPTWIYDHADSAVDAASSMDGQIVVKPTISAGSRDTALLDANSPVVENLARKIESDGKRIIIQPAIPSVVEEGELASLWFDGEFSHALRKGPILAAGGGFLGGAYTEHVAPATMTDATHQACKAVMAAITRMLAERLSIAEPLLYARLDLVNGNNGPLLLEAELFEPSYFLVTAPGSELRFAQALARRL